MEKGSAKKPKSDKKLRTPVPTVRQSDCAGSNGSAASEGPGEGPSKPNQERPAWMYEPENFKKAKETKRKGAKASKRKTTEASTPSGGAGGGSAASGAAPSKKTRTKQTAAIVIQTAMTEEQAIEYVQKEYEIDYTSEDFPKIASLVAKVVTATTALDEARFKRETVHQARTAAQSEYDQAKRELDYGKANIEAELLQARETVRELEAELEEVKKNSAKHEMMLQLKKLAVDGRTEQKEAAQQVEAECRRQKNEATTALEKALEKLDKPADGSEEEEEITMTTPRQGAAGLESSDSDE